MSRQITTAGDYMIEVNNGELKLLGPHGSEKDAQGSVYSWVDAFTDMSVDFHPCVTRFRLRTGDLEDDARDIIGTLQESGAPNILDWQIDVDTLPANTLPPVASPASMALMRFRDGATCSPET
jgi:hypothetical protein